MLTRRTLLVLAALASCFLLPARAEDEAKPSVKHVIHVSVDGLNPTLLRDLITADKSGRYGNFKRLITEGAATLNARTDYTQADTLPNHTCMVTGRPVHQPSGWDEKLHHGYTNNKQPDADDTLHNQGNTRAGYIASVFDVAHDQGLSTALFASKSKFVIYSHSYDEKFGAPDLTGMSHGRAKIDGGFVEPKHETNNTQDINSKKMQAELLKQLPKRRFNYTFVHYREPDSAGHAKGWGSEAWNKAVHEVDDYLGELLKVVEGDEQLKDRTVIILTADHGGVPGTKNHKDAGRPEDYTIPFIVWGAGVSRGAELYALNTPVRADPGTSRPDYNAKPQPIRNGDSGNLALKLLGRPPIPGSSINAAQDLRVSQ